MTVDDIIRPPDDLSSFFQGFIFGLIIMAIFLIFSIPISAFVATQFGWNFNLCSILCNCVSSS